MLDKFYDMLAEKIDPALIQKPSTENKLEAKNDIRAKGGLSLLGQNRAKERLYKNNQRRSPLSRNSLFLNRKADLATPNSPINKVNVQGSLLGSRNRN